MRIRLSRSESRFMTFRRQHRTANTNKLLDRRKPGGRLKCENVKCCSTHTFVVTQPGSALFSAFTCGGWFVGGLYNVTKRFFGVNLCVARNNI